MKREVYKDLCSLISRLMIKHRPPWIIYIQIKANAQLRILLSTGLEERSCQKSSWATSTSELKSGNSRNSSKIPAMSLMSIFLRTILAEPGDLHSSPLIPRKISKPLLIKTWRCSTEENYPLEEQTTIKDLQEMTIDSETL